MGGLRKWWASLVAVVGLAIGVAAGPRLMLSAQDVPVKVPDSSDEVEPEPTREKMINLNPNFSLRIRQSRTTSDFRLRRPGDRVPEGITKVEADQIRETMKGAIRLLFAVQDDKGVIDTYSADRASDLRPMLAGHHALAVWTLLECGVVPSDPKLKRAVDAMVDLANRGAGGLKWIFTPERTRTNEMSKPRKPNPKGVDKLETIELYYLLKALEALAQAREHEVRRISATSDREREVPDTLVRDNRLAPGKFDRFSPAERALVRAATNAILFRYLEEKREFGEHVNDVVGNAQYRYHAVMGLLASYRLTGIAPKKKLLEQLTTPMIGSDKLKYRRHSLHFAHAMASNSADVPAAPLPVEYDCIGFGRGSGRGGFNPRSNAEGTCIVVALRRMRSGVASPGRFSTETKSMDKALCEGIATFARYLPATGPDAHTVPVPEEQDQTMTEFVSAKFPYDFARHSGHPKYIGEHALIFAQVGWMLGNDTIGHCEWFPGMMREITPRHEFAKSFKVEEAPASESKDEAKDRINRFEVMRRNMHPERLCELIMLAEGLARTPVWVKE